MLVAVGVMGVLVGVGVIPRGCAAATGSSWMRTIPNITAIIAKVIRAIFDFGMIITPELSTVDQRQKRIVC